MRNIKRNKRRNKTIGVIIIILTIASFISIQFVVVKRVLKQTKDLTEINGIIENVSIEKIHKRFVGYNYAFVINIKGEPIAYAIHEKNKRAYEYLNFHNVIGSRCKILFDKSGHNSSDKLTYHVYLLEIGREQILDISESKQSDKTGLFIFGLFDIIVIIMFLYIKKRNK